VDEALDRGGRGAGLGEDAPHGIRDALQQVLRRGGDLGEDEAAAVVESHDVRERAADASERPVDAGCGPRPLV